MSGVFGRRTVVICACNLAVIVLNISVWSYNPNHRTRSIYNDVRVNIEKSAESDDVIFVQYRDDELAAPVDATKSRQVRRNSRRTGLSSEDQDGGGGPRKKPPISDMLYEATMNQTVGLFYSRRTTDYRHYKVPKIQYTDLVRCSAILSGNANELKKAANVLKSHPKVPIYEEKYLEWTKDCHTFRKNRGYVEMALSAEEEQFPLAFSIAMYTDVEQTERLLRAIYQPQNLYCIHVDTKSSLLIHRTVAAIARCFDNVWVATHLDKIKWGDVSVLLPEINCMRDLVRYYRRQFRYFINLTGQEFPLRTNLELVRIARIFNGSNDIAGSTSRMDMERVKYRWTHRWSKTYQQTIFYNTFQPKAPFNANVTFFKGELHGLFSKGMVEYLVENAVADSYLKWCSDSGHPSEHYWNTLNYNRFLGAPGGYIGPLAVADAYSPMPIIRAKHWVGLFDNRTCGGKEQRGICVYGVTDLPWLNERRELFANKFQLTYEYLALDCLEERHRNRTASRGVGVDFDRQFYRGLPTVKHSRKDGLL